MIKTPACGKSPHCWSKILCFLSGLPVPTFVAISHLCTLDVFDLQAVTLLNRRKMSCYLDLIHGQRLIGTGDTRWEPQMMSPFKLSSFWQLLNHTDLCKRLSLLSYGHLPSSVFPIAIYVIKSYPGSLNVKQDGLFHTL